jgi:hypothetical protein
MYTYGKGGVRRMVPRDSPLKNSLAIMRDISSNEKMMGSIQRRLAAAASTSTSMGRVTSAAGNTSSLAGTYGNASFDTQLVALLALWETNLCVRCWRSSRAIPTFGPRCAVRLGACRPR